MNYKYRTKGTCAQEITFTLEDNVVSNINFYGGCNGNLKAISAILDGYTVEQIESKVKGIKCGYKDTSCSDQLACAVRAAYEDSKKEA